MNVGTKDLKNRLSHYLRLVREGERITVTDHGKPIAEIRTVAPPPKDDAAALAELERQGAVTMGAGKLSDRAPVRAKGRRLLSSRIIEDRG